ncbi:hypothetical protein LF1_09570 [Rubripirellula obstinata]|uniref:Uncharacterized protein n=1 Tax=Rubripirellula obstinata TaxID=406547 RepID=A0A5B1CBF9_9BACT|nr:hypothetical protein LF1_09570 [Rubripirellula obstinata]
MRGETRGAMPTRLNELRNERGISVAIRRGRRLNNCRIGVVDRSAIITLVNSPRGTEALCRGCKSPDGSLIPHQFSGSVSRLRRETEPEN